MSSQPKSHHYVPEWYQRRFMVPAAHAHKLHYLDMKPEKVMHPDGGFHFRTARRQLGPDQCFATDYFYQLRLGAYVSNGLETVFFGQIDDAGAKAVEFYCDYKLNDQAIESFQPLMKYIDAQKWRTPKGLDYLKWQIRKNLRGRTVSQQVEHQMALMFLQQFHMHHCTIWSEAVWEILSCDNTQTKFIVSDNPVTVYNKGVFPGSVGAHYPLDPGIELLGSHTLFPLSYNRCLVLTNLGYVRDPSVSPIKQRENPRYYQQGLFDIRKIQTGRQLNEQEVLAINYIMKQRATRYIAAAYEGWLYPEKHLTNRTWNKLGGKYFLMPDPRKVSFTTGILMGGDGWGWGADEYGRRMSRDKDKDVKALRAREFRTFQKAKQSWDSAFGPLSHKEQRRAFFGFDRDGRD
jgi:hypothetical protein